MVSKQIIDMLTVVNQENTGLAFKSTDPLNPENAALPCEQALGLGAQSVAQSMALAIQDSADLLRNISTIETTAIGAATTKWLEDPYNVAYAPMIAAFGQVITETAGLLTTIGENASQVLKDFIDVAEGNKPSA